MTGHASYRLTHFTSPEALANAANFDEAIFSQRRLDGAGGEIKQAVASAEAYHRMAALGGIIFGLVDVNTEWRRDGGEIRGLAAVAMQADRSADEPILRHMDSKTCYMWGLATDPACRGQALGGFLLDTAINLAIKGGRTRMVSTVHPSNISADMFLNRGFLGVALQDVYYPLPDNDGMRLIVLRDELQDKHWHQKRAGPENRQIFIPKTVLHEEDNPTPAFRALMTLLEIGYCVRRVLRPPGDPESIGFELSKYRGDPSLIPLMLFPYNSLAEGYNTVIGPGERLWQQMTSYVLNLMDRMGAAHTYRTPPPSSFLPLTAQYRWLFIDWLRTYHQHIRTTVETNTAADTPPQNTAGNREHLLYSEALRYSFLSLEHDWLRVILELLPKDDLTWAAAKAQLIPTFPSDELQQDSQRLCERNIEIYRLLAGSPAERQLTGKIPALPPVKSASNDALLHSVRLARVRASLTPYTKKEGRS